MRNLQLFKYLIKCRFLILAFLFSIITLPNALYSQDGEVSGVVFGDVTNNGVNDPGDVGVAGVVVNLISSGTVVLTTTTDADGEYSFNDLSYGSYSIDVIVDGADYRFSPTGIDSDVDGDGVGVPFEIEDSEPLIVDAGIVEVSANLVCQGSEDNPVATNMSLDPVTCSDVITAPVGRSDIGVEVRYNGELILNNTVTCEHAGKVVNIKYVYITGSRSGQDACWENRLIEDKAQPVFQCTATAQIACYQSVALNDAATIINNDVCHRTASIPSFTDVSLTPLSGATVTDCSEIISYDYDTGPSIRIDCADVANNGATFMAKYERVFTAIDKNNYVSTCTQEIFVERPNLIETGAGANLVWPAAVVDVTCTTTNFDPQAGSATIGYPKYQPTGSLSFDITETVSACMLSATKVDQVIEKCSSNGVALERQIIRTWTVMNMASCSNQMFEFVQQINVTPIALVIQPINGNDIITISTALGRASDSHSECLSSTTENLPLALIDETSLCSGVTAADITITARIADTYTVVNGGTISAPGLGIGEYPVVFTASGPCSTYGVRNATLRVVDNVAPQASCNSIGPLTLSSSSARITADQLAGDSYDNCKSTVYHMITRLNADDSFAQPLAAFVDVNCADIGTLVPVLAVVFDMDPTDPGNWEEDNILDITSVDPNGPLANFKGLWSYCWSTVNVDKATEPRIRGCGTPQSFTVVAGKCSPDQPTIVNGAISYPDFQNSLVFDPVCGEVLTAILVEDSFGDRSCTGTVTTSTLTRKITLSYTARDGSTKTLVCSQQIVITDNTPVSIVVNDAKDIVGCTGLDIDNLSAQAVYDFILSKSPNTVTVTGDECDDLDIYVAFEHDPFIKSEPMIVTGSILVWPVLPDGVCNTLPTEKIKLCFEFTGDDCKLPSPEVMVAVPECPDGGGAFTTELIEATLASGQDRDDFNFVWTEESIVTVVLENNSGNDYTFNTNDLEVGKSYVVTVSRKDDTNISTTSAAFTLPNCCSDPTITFQNPDDGTSASFLVSNGDVADYNWIWYEGTRTDIGDPFAAPIQDVPNDLEISGLDPETPYVLILTEIANTECRDTSSNETAGTQRIVGRVASEFGAPVQNVRVALEVNQAASSITEGGIMSEVMTDELGEFEFDDFNLSSLNQLSLVKDGDDRDNISTRDLLVMSRHILGVKEISSPYAYIAADLTGNGKISTGDMLLMQKIVLGVTHDMPNNTSWRFVREDHVFDDMNSILDYEFPENFSFTGEETDAELKDMNFVAIKVGELAGAYGAQLQGGNSTSKTLSLQTDNQKLLPGAVIEVPIRAGDAQNLSGYQHAYKFDTDKIVFTGIDFGKELDLGDNNFGYQHLGDGILTTSWFDVNEKNIKAGTVIYTLRFEVRAAAQLKDVLEISSKHTQAEAYFDEDKLGNVQFTFGDIDTDKLVLTNAPNPFTESTQIKFEAPNKGEAVIRVSDISGKEVHRIELTAVKGENQLELNKADLKDAGIYIMKIDLNGSSATQKIVLMK